jgi:pimeloyl-ACP methyl ester carboxylesterase
MRQRRRERKQRSAPDLPEPVALRFAHGDHELRLFRWPQPQRDLPTRLLFVHGIGMGHAVYDRFVETAHLECEVVCVDLPGFGDSPEPRDPLSIAGTADLLAACIRRLRLGPLTAVGHSMGAQVVAELAARHPSLVERAILIAPTVNRHERTVGKQVWRMLQDSANNSPVVLAKGLIAYLRTGPLWFVKKLRPTLEHRIEDCLPRIARPALVLRGEEDVVSPREWGRELTELLPEGELREIEGRGHEALISSGEPAARIVLDWVAEHQAETARVSRAAVPRRR